MKVKLLSLALMFALVAALFGAPAPAKAVGYGTAFVTSITYQNIGTDTAHLYVDFYPADGSAAINFPLPDLPANAGSSLYVGSVTTISAGFQGSAVMTSDQPMAAVLVQLPPASSSVKNRPLSSGMTNGAPSVLIATVLKNQFHTNTIFVVQNADTARNRVTVNLIPLSGAAITLPTVDLNPGQAKYYDLAQLPELNGFASFNGSATIDAVQLDGSGNPTTTPGSVVATSLELATATNANPDAVYAFEGTAEKATTIFMPTALCNAFGGQNSFYAVQNTSATNTAAVTVTYSSGATDTANIGPGQKASFAGCANGQNSNGFSGSATITSTQDIVAIGKVSGNGLSTAFLGFKSGATKIALPYIRWTESRWAPNGRQRAYIAIQNVSTTQTLAAGDVIVNYYDKNGALVGSHELPAMGPGAKANSNASMIPGFPDAAKEFGYYTDGTFGGSATVTTKAGVTAQLAVVVRVASNLNGTQLVAEDYNGIVIP